MEYQNHATRKRRRQEALAIYAEIASALGLSVTADASATELLDYVLSPETAELIQMKLSCLKKRAAGAEPLPLLAGGTATRLGGGAAWAI